MSTAKATAALLAVLGACYASALAVAPARALAQARQVDLVCLGSAQFDFAPPLSFHSTSASLIVQRTCRAAPHVGSPRMKSGITFGPRAAIGSSCPPLLLRIMGSGLKRH